MKVLPSLLLVVAVAAAASGQPQNVPPHMLFVPQRYHVGAAESISIASYSARMTVEAIVSYETCRCDSNGIRRCGGNTVFSTASALARLGFPAILEVQMPGLDDLRNRNYFVALLANNGSINFLSQQRISFSGNSFGFLLVKTNKPIYKPSQDVSFCMAYVDKSLKPFNIDTEAEVRVTDARSRQIKKWDSVRIGGNGFACLEFPLADEPNLGTWRIDASVKVPGSEGPCRVFYSIPSANCDFKVEEFVLPRFEVSLNGPRHILQEDDVIQGVVSAKYTFGDDVLGTVKINATIISSQRRERLIIYNRVARLTNGAFTFRIRGDAYRDQVRYRYDPFCVKSSIVIVAEVEESGRGTNQTATLTIPLVANPVSLKFTDENPKLFKPGLNHTMKAQASYADGTPARSTAVKIIATVNNGKQTIFDATILADSSDGSIMQTIFIPENSNCLKITMAPEGDSPTCKEARVCFSPSPSYSPSLSFLQLDYVSRNRLPLKVGSRARLRATSTTPFQLLHVLVIGQGSIQHHTYHFRRNGTTSGTVAFQIRYSMAPRVKVLAVFSREDGELVADLIELPVRCELENEVSVRFNRSTASPGDPIRVALQASPRSLVLLSVIDQGLTLLAETCKSLGSDNICRLLRSLTSGTLSGGVSCSLESTGDCCPASCSEPTKYGVSTVFNAAGFSLRSNMFQPRPPFVPRPTIRQPFFFRTDIDFEFDRGPVNPGQEGNVELPTISPTDTKLSNEDSGQVRQFFPESWLFTLQQTDINGEASLTERIPDTITTWVAEGVALSSRAGLGLSSPTLLTVSKPFFVSLELPFSINFGEIVTITPLIFLFNRRVNSVLATISVQLDDDLDLVESTGLDDKSQLRVQSGRSTPFTLKLRSRAIGELLITVSAVSDGGQTDIVQKPLLVKPGCERFEMTENVFAEGSDQYCFNFTVPSCVIPGSAKAVISVTGDVMSPPSLDRLLVLPTGCGEQNLVKTATNLVVAQYLDATEQLSDFIAVKIRSNIERGYQRQLTYLQSPGCFSIWSHGDCSLWLTAAAVNVFSGITNYFEERDESIEVVDRAVVDGAINYIRSKQNSNGAFPVVGRVHNYKLLNQKDRVAHTAFSLLALKQYTGVFSASSSVTTAIDRAQRYIITTISGGAPICNYGQALGTYAVLFMTKRPTTLMRSMVETLKSRISRSRAYPGTCFVCNQCPDDELTREDGIDCQGRPRSEGSAACVETTAYTLLALLEAEDEEDTVCLAQWLVRIRSGHGGFWSSQDTVVAMQALSEFATQTFTTDLDKRVTFDIPGLREEPVSQSISGRNRFERSDVEVPSVPSNSNCVRWRGNGTVIIQGSVAYYGCNCCEETRAFSLELATDSGESPFATVLQLTIRIRYLAGEESNMAIVDVEIPSGYVYTGWRFADLLDRNAEAERVDQRGSNVIFYFNSVPGDRHTTIIVNFVQQFEVENAQQLPVVIYDYYDPGQTLTRYYLPVTSQPLPHVDTPPLNTLVPPTPPVPRSTSPPGTSSPRPVSPPDSGEE